MDESRRALTPGGFSALSSGTVLDRYRIDSVIAAGGFGITYLCNHVTLGKLYALKEHFPRQFAYRDGTTMDVRPTDPDTFSWTLGRFIQEGRALASCHHPNVVSVADVFEANQTAYMVLGYEEGSSLKTWLDRLGRPPTQDEIDAILAPLLDALAYVHAQGLLHRDIAPDNIMIRSDGKPCLIDFGSARQAVAERSQVMSALVKSGYSPPEQYTRAGRMQGPWSDIYAMGATLYRMVTGKTLPESTDRSIEDEVRPVRDMIPDRDAYRPGFLDGIDKALAFHYAKRPQSIAEWRGGLMGDGAVPQAAAAAPAAAQVSIGASPPPSHRPPDSGGDTSDRPAPPPAPARGSKNRKALAVLAAILLIGGVGYGIAAHQAASKRAAAILKAEDDARVQRDQEGVRSAAAKRKADDDAREQVEATRRDRERVTREAARFKAEREAEEARAAEARRKRIEEEQKIAALREESERRIREEAERRAREETDRRAREETERRENERREADRIANSSHLFNPAAVPSFDCAAYGRQPVAERSPQAHLLCISTDAAEADNRLGAIYGARIQGLADATRREFIETQRQWIIQRNRICKADWADLATSSSREPVARCLVRETNDRIRLLSLGINPQVRPESAVAPPAVATSVFNGHWFSAEWKYGYRLQDGVGVATSTNSPRFNVGDVIIRIRAVAPNIFEGEQVYRDGRWYQIRGELRSDGRIYITGEKNVNWHMERIN